MYHGVVVGEDDLWEAPLAKPTSDGLEGWKSVKPVAAQPILNAPCSTKKLEKDSIPISSTFSDVQVAVCIALPDPDKRSNIPSVALGTRQISYRG